MPVLPLLAIVITLAASSSPVSSAGHPRLLFGAGDIPQLQTRAAQDPWRRIKSVVGHSTSLVYSGDGNYYERLASMRTVMRQAALACILFPEDRQAYVCHIVEQMRHWDDINGLRRQRPDSNWTSMITGCDGFFLSVIALGPASLADLFQSFDGLVDMTLPDDALRFGHRLSHAEYLFSLMTDN